MISPGASAAAAASSGTVEEKLSNLQAQQEMENLRAEVKDLQEKIETLKGTFYFSFILFLAMYLDVLTYLCMYVCMCL